MFACSGGPPNHRARYWFVGCPVGRAPNPDRKGKIKRTLFLFLSGGRKYPPYKELPSYVSLARAGHQVARASNLHPYETPLGRATSPVGQGQTIPNLFRIAWVGNHDARARYCLVSLLRRAGDQSRPTGHRQGKRKHSLFDSCRTDDKTRPKSNCHHTFRLLGRETNPHQKATLIHIIPLSGGRRVPPDRTIQPTPFLFLVGG